MTAVVGLAVVGRFVVGRFVVGVAESAGPDVPGVPTLPEPAAPVPDLAVWAIDPQGIRRGQLAALACTAVPRDADVGTWQVTVDGRDELAARLAPGWRVLISDGLTSMSGRALTFDWEQTGGNLDLTIAGVDELDRLAGRLVYPDPARAAEAQGESHYKQSGPAESVICELVRRNAGTSAIAIRRSPRLVVATSRGRGSRVSVSERMSSLLEVARRIAHTDGLTFAALEDGNRVLFEVRARRDLSRQVRFTDLNGGFAGGRIGLAAPTLTAAIVAGQGQGASRAVREHLAPVDEWGTRIEQFLDRRDTPEDDVLEAAGRDALSEGAATGTASVEVQEAHGRVLGVDYLIGDIVTAQISEGVTISEPVRSATITWTPHGRDVKLTLGDPAEEDEPGWVRRVRALAARLNRQEAT